MKRLVLLSVFCFITLLAAAQNKPKPKPKTGNSGSKPASQQQTPPQQQQQQPQANNQPVTPPKPKKPRTPKKDGYIYTESVADTVVPYSKVNEEDVVYTKRIWREIDFRDKGNQALTSPKVNLIATIYEAISNGELDLYGIDDQDFKKDPVGNEKADKNDKNYKTANNKFSAADTAFLGVNRNTSELNGANNDFFAVNFKGIRIKEDWILDIKRGIFEPRIVGIAPIRLDSKASVNTDGSPILDAKGQPLPPNVLEQPVGWIYFDDLRNILSKKKIANDGNDNSGITFDDIFLRRLFYSNIVKQSNSADIGINGIEINGRLLTPKEQLLEAEKIKKEMADFEQGLWEY